VHDGIDVIADYDDEVVAMCDGVIVDSRSGGWWGKGAQASHGHPINDGDGIIQLQCSIDAGPFKPGLIIGYGHTEKSSVRVGQKVLAGQRIGRIGFANAPHIHLMVRGPNVGGGRPMGIGDRDPAPYLSYALKEDN
jgi:murein DD-endopeptidase MepM/ murein hydrolase activator NlpD